MAKLPSTIKNMALSLTIISLVMSAALGFVYISTKEPIQKSKNQKVIDAIARVVPEFNNNPYAEKYDLDDLECYPARMNGQLVATAIQTYSDNGYSGRIILMVGLKPDGRIYNISVLDQKETPGLGTKMTEPKFKDQFKDKNPGTDVIKVTKDGGTIDAIAASTITSRAFCEAVQKAYDAYMKGGKKE